LKPDTSRLNVEGRIEAWFTCDEHVRSFA